MAFLIDEYLSGRMERHELLEFSDLFDDLQSKEGLNTFLDINDQHVRALEHLRDLVRTQAARASAMAADTADDPIQVSDATSSGSLQSSPAFREQKCSAPRSSPTYRGVSFGHIGSGR
jgi:hypothetical protein